MYFRCDSIKVRAFRFCERILRFSQAKILRFFLWLSAKYVKMHFDTVSTRVHLILHIRITIYDYILYLTNRNMIYRTAFSTDNFQRIWAVLSYVFQIFGWEAADVFYIVFFVTWTIPDYITLHCDGWLELAEETEDDIFRINFAFAVKLTYARAGSESVFYTAE